MYWSTMTKSPGANVLPQAAHGRDGDDIGAARAASGRRCWRGRGPRSGYAHGRARDGARRPPAGPFRRPDQNLVRGLAPGGLDLDPAGALPARRSGRPPIRRSRQSFCPSRPPAASFAQNRGWVRQGKGQSRRCGGGQSASRLVSIGQSGWPLSQPCTSAPSAASSLCRSAILRRTVARWAVLRALTSVQIGA